MEAELFDADGNSIFKADGTFRTFAGAEAEADALLKEFADGLKEKERQEAAEPEEARAKDVPISRGDIPADAYDAPETIEVENMPEGLDGQISIRETGDDKPNYEVDAVVQDADGENLAEHHSEHPSKARAEKEGRDWVNRAAEGIQNTEAPAPEEPSKKKSTKPKKELPQDEKVRFSQLNEEEQAGVLRNIAEVEAMAVNMAGIRADEVKPGDFLKHRQLGHYEKVVRIERGKEYGMDRVILWVYNPIAGKEQPRPFKADSPLEFVRRIEGEGPKEKFPVGKPRGRAKRPDIKRQDPREKVVVREGRKEGAKGKDRGYFKDANGEPVMVGDVVIFADPKRAGKFGRGIVRRRVGDQVDEGKKVGGVPRAGKVYLDNVFVQWENEEVFGQINQGGRQVVADNLIIVNDNPDDVLANIKDKPWKGGVAKPNRRGAGVPAGKGPAAPKAEAPELPKAAPNMPQQIVKKTVKDLNDGEFELSLVKIGDIYEGAVINKQNNKIQIVVRDRNEQNARVELARAGDYIQQAAAGDEIIPRDLPDLDKVDAQDVQPQQDANLLSEDDVEKQFMLKGSQFVRDKGVKVLDRVENVKVGDFIMTRRGNIGRVIETTEVGDRVRIKVRYRSGMEYEYKPYRKDLQIDGLYRIPTKENPDPQAAIPKVKKPTAPVQAENNANAIDFPTAARRLALAKKNLPKIKDVYRGSEKEGIRAVNAAHKALKSGDIDRFNIYADRAKRRLEGKDKYSGFLDELQDIQNGLSGNPNLPKAIEPIKEFNGPSVEELDPVAVAEERKNNGENPVQLSPFWQEKFVKSADFWSDLARNGIYGDQLKEEIRAFFADGEPKPLAALSPEARKMLAAIANNKLLDRRRSAEENAEIKNIADLALKLHAERLAFEPNVNEWGPGEALANLDIKELERVASGGNRKGILEFNGRQWFVKRMGTGGGRTGTNRTYLVVDMETGRRYYFKQDENKAAIDGEMAGAAFFRAAGIMGAYMAMRHSSNERVVITTEVGENLALKKAPVQAHELTPDDLDFITKGHIPQAMMFAIVDALIDNQDRHMNNFKGAQDDNRGVNVGDNGKLMLLPIDQGLGDVFQAPGQANSPFDFLNKGYGRSGIPKRLKRFIGTDAFYELLQMTGQQALQALRRDYPVGKAPEVDIIAQRLEELLAVPRADWGA